MSFIIDSHHCTQYKSPIVQFLIHAIWYCGDTFMCLFLWLTRICHVEMIYNSTSFPLEHTNILEKSFSETKICFTISLSLLDILVDTGNAQPPCVSHIYKETAEIEYQLDCSRQFPKMLYCMTFLIGFTDHPQ